MRLPSLKLIDWIRHNGDFPRAFEYPHSQSPLKFMRWLLRGREPLSALKFANLPAFETWVFLHIPKTAGTAFIEGATHCRDFTLLSVRRIPGMNQRERRALLRKAVRTRKLIVHGHTHVNHWKDYFRWSGRERVFTVLRDPVDIQMSNVNFIVGRISSALESPAVDKSKLNENVRRWRQAYDQGKFGASTKDDLDAVCSWLAMANRPFEPSAAFALALMSSEPYVTTYSSMMSKFLSLGNQPVDQIVSFVRDLGLYAVPIKYAGDFTRQTFGFELPKGVNVRAANVLAKEQVDFGLDGKADRQGRGTLFGTDEIRLGAGPGRDDQDGELKRGQELAALLGIRRASGAHRTTSRPK